MDPTQRTTLAVHLHGERIGQIHRLPGEKQFFAFDQSYLENPNRNTLSLSFKSQSGGLVTAIRPVHRRVPPFFSNLLPEGHLRTYLATQAGVNSQREFHLLAALGADLPGAVTIRPLDANNREEPLVPRSKRTNNRKAPLRFSLAGMQLKFSAIGEASGGLTIPVQGIGGSWIVKLPSLRFNAVSENEFVMLELARAIGIEVPRLAMIPVRNIAGLPKDAASLPGMALAAQRFDRSNNGDPIHMEDFAQVFGLYPESKYKSASYANIARVLQAESGPHAVQDFVARLTFNILIGNADMHLKNWSLLYPDKLRPTLAPAYDFVSTLPYISDDSLALTLGGSRSLSEITADQLRRFADAASLPLRPLIDTVAATTEATTEAWSRLSQRSLLPASMRKQIQQQIDSTARRTQKGLA